MGGGGGGAQKIMCAHTLRERNLKSQSAGVQEVLGFLMLYHAIWALFLDAKWD